MCVRNLLDILLENCTGLYVEHPTVLPVCVEFNISCVSVLCNCIIDTCGVYKNKIYFALRLG